MLGAGLLIVSILIEIPLTNIKYPCAKIYTYWSSFHALIRVTHIANPRVKGIVRLHGV